MPEPQCAVDDLTGSGSTSPLEHVITINTASSTPMSAMQDVDLSDSCSVTEAALINQNQQVSELKVKLLQERENNERLNKTIATLKAGTASLLNTCEQAQEGISNRLIREISRLKNAQLAMCDDIEAHEARLVSVLEERLKTLKTEKIELENAMEQEQERIVNRLQRQMEELYVLASASNPGASTESLLLSKSTSPTFPITATTTTMTTSAATISPVVAASGHYSEKETELYRQIARLQEENQALLMENIKLHNKLRRQSIEDSPLIEPLISPSLLPLCRSDSVSSSGITGNCKTKAGSIVDLSHLSHTRRSFNLDSSPKGGATSDSDSPSHF